MSSPAVEKTVEMATCWIAAENALLHVQRRHIQIEAIFERHGIQRSEYAIYAGFDEPGIRGGLGFLEQVHIFTLATIVETSPLLTELGKILSPFCCLVFTGASVLALPIFKMDGTLWDPRNFVTEMASNYVHRGSSAARCPTVISVSQMTKDNDKGNGDENPGDSPRNNERVQGHPANSSNRDMDEISYAANSKREMKETTDSPNIRFEVESNIYNADGFSQDVRTIGQLTIRMDNKGPSLQVQFTKLDLDNSYPPNLASDPYHQFYTKIDIDSRLWSRLDGYKPERSRRFPLKETAVTVSGKHTESKVGSGIIGGTATGAASGSYSRAAEEGRSSATRNFSRILKGSRMGAIWWGFEVDDTNLQEGGMAFEEAERPSIIFTFRPEDDNTIPIPEEIDVEVKSFWSCLPALPAAELNVVWLQRILLASKGSSARYSHLCQITTLNIPPDLKQHSDHIAILSVNTTGNGRG